MESQPIQTTQDVLGWTLREALELALGPEGIAEFLPATDED
jgi:hypothetical protein